VADSYRVLIIEDDPDPTTYLRLALLPTKHAEHRVQCPATTRSLLRGVTPSSQPLVLILDEVPARLKVLAAYFDDAGCAVIAADDVEQALMISSVVSPDLMVLPEQRPGIGGAGLDRVRSQHPTCPVAVTTVLDTEADSVSDTTAASMNELPSITGWPGRETTRSRDHRIFMGPKA
jgi:DNA-binding response OmpR family regulator